MRGEGQLLAGRGQHRPHRRDHHRGVAHDDVQVPVDPLDQQASVDGLGRLLGHGGQQHRLVAGQSGGQPAGHGDLQIGGDVGDQRRGDAGELTVLRPVQLRGGLLDRQQRSGQRQQRAEQARDDRDQFRGAVVLTGFGHGGRW